MIFNGEKFLILSHFDADGAGAAMLFKTCYPDQVTTIKACGYGKLEKTIKNNACSNLLITDLSLESNHIKAINQNYNNIFWIDHHQSSLHQNVPKGWKVFLNTKISATKICYLYLTKQGFDLRYTKAFVETVNNYDIWGKDGSGPSKNAILLNNIFWDQMFWGFCKTFKDYTWHPSVWKRAKELERIKRKEISKYETYEIENFLRVTMAESHISDIPLQYDEPHNIIIKKNLSVSLRTTNINLADFYLELNQEGISTGGHEHAGACDLIGSKYEHNIMDFIEKFYNYLKDTNNDES